MKKQRIVTRVTKLSFLIVYNSLYRRNQVFEHSNIFQSHFGLISRQIAQQLKVSRTTVRNKKRLIEEFICIHYPTYIHTFTSYTGILSSFYTEYPEYIKEIFQNLSATCYLFGNQEKILCFVNTTLPSYVTHVFEELEKKGIVEDLNTEITVRSWNKIVDEFQLGRISEKYFWMFKRKIKKRKK